MIGYTESQLSRIARNFGVSDWTEIATVSVGVGIVPTSRTNHVLGFFKGYWGGLYWFSNL